MFSLRRFAAAGAAVAAVAGTVALAGPALSASAAPRCTAPTAAQCEGKPAPKLVLPAPKPTLHFGVCGIVGAPRCAPKPRPVLPAHPVLPVLPRPVLPVTTTTCGCSSTVVYPYTITKGVAVRFRGVRYTEVANPWFRAGRPRLLYVSASGECLSLTGGRLVRYVHPVVAVRLRVAKPRLRLAVAATSCGCGVSLPVLPKPVTPVLPVTVTETSCGCGTTSTVLYPYTITRGYEVTLSGVSYYQVANPWFTLVGGPRLLYVDPGTGECLVGPGRPGLRGPLRPFDPAPLVR